MGTEGETLLSLARGASDMAPSLCRAATCRITAMVTTDPGRRRQQPGPMGWRGALLQGVAVLPVSSRGVNAGGGGGGGDVHFFSCFLQGRGGGK